MASMVQIPRSALAALAAVAVAGVIAVAFLLGRASVPARPGEAPAADLPATIPVPMPPAQAPASAGSPPATAHPVPAPLPRGPASAPPPSERAAVAAYFNAIEAIQPAPGGDLQAVAQEVAAGLGKGDTSGLDGMVRQAESTRERLAALRPPRPCAAYHQALLASLDEGLDLMRSIRSLVASPNPAAQAPDLAGRASAMKAHADSLQEQEADLKRRYVD